MPSLRVLNELQIKQGGVVATYKLGTVNGYYKPADGKFYYEPTYETEIEGAPNLVYADIGGNALYIYKTSTSSFVKVSGEGGSADNLKFGYLNSTNGKFYEDSSYTTEITPNTENIYIDLGDNKIYRYDITNTEYVIIGGGGAGGDAIEGYYNATDGKFYEESTFVTEITGEEGQIYVDKGGNKTYRYDATNTEFVLIGGSDYTAGFGININTNDEISTTDFVGTQATWDALPAADKAKYDFIHITDDTSSVVYKPGHSISDGTTEKTQRDGLVFEGFTVTDDSTNEVTKIAEIPYTAGDGIDITNKEITVGDEIAREWTGTQAQWNAIVDKSPYDGWTINITDDQTSGIGVVVDTVADGNMNAVTSNAVADVVADINSDLTALITPAKIATFSAPSASFNTSQVVPDLSQYKKVYIYIYYRGGGVIGMTEFDPTDPNIGTNNKSVMGTMAWDGTRVWSIKVQYSSNTLYNLTTMATMPDAGIIVEWWAI